MITWKASIKFLICCEKSFCSPTPHAPLSPYKPFSSIYCTCVCHMQTVAAFPQEKSWNSEKVNTHSNVFLTVECILLSLLKTEKRLSIKGQRQRDIRK